MLVSNISIFLGLALTACADWVCYLLSASPTPSIRPFYNYNSNRNPTKTRCVPIVGSSVFPYGSCVSYDPNGFVIMDKNGNALQQACRKARQKIYYKKLLILLQLRYYVVEIYC